MTLIKLPVLTYMQITVEGKQRQDQVELYLPPSQVICFSAHPSFPQDKTIVWLHPGVYDSRFHTPLDVPLPVDVVAELVNKALGSVGVLAQQ